MKVCLVLEAGYRDWIIEKFAVRLQEHLGPCGLDAHIAERPSAGVDINHWMFYGHAWQYHVNERYDVLGRNTVMITHIDDPLKTRIVKEVLRDTALLGVCLSRMTVDELCGRGINRTQLCYVTPGHDGRVAPRRIVIGIASRVRADGRKRESLLVRLAEKVNLDLFHFEIMGRGWEAILPALERAGATVRHYPESGDFNQDYLVLLERLRGCDYYLYLGLDEGSMGIFDALAAGIPTIVTRQGFHLDIEHGITHGFCDGKELVQIFEEIARKRRNQLSVVKQFTWAAYARRHAIIWRACLSDRQAEIPSLLHQDDSPPVLQTRRMQSLRSLLAYHANIRSSVYLSQFVKREKERFWRRLSRVRRRLRAMTNC